MGTDISQFFWVATVAAVLLCVCGLYCLIAGHNMIRIIIAIELMSKGVVLFLGAIGKATGLMAQTQAFIITIVVVEAVAIAIAAGIVVSTFNRQGSIDVRVLRNLKG